MKNIFNYLIVILFFFYTTSPIKSQTVIDLRTGVDNAGNLIAISSSDPKWTINTPTDWPNSPSGPFHPINRGSGYVPGGLLEPITSNSGWLSPALDAAGVSIATNAGTYYYKCIFNVSGCPVQFATLYIEDFFVDNTCNDISMNGVSIAPAGTFGGALSCCSNYVVPVSLGQNVLMLTVQNNITYTGAQFTAHLILPTCQGPDIIIKDKNGIETSMFCMDQDVFLDLKGLNSGPYVLSFLKDDGSGNFNISASTSQIIGSQSNVNLSEIDNIFQNQFRLIYPGVTYRLSLTVNTSCGPLVKTKDFTFSCCGDNRFDLVNDGYTLSGHVAGVLTTANWIVYTFPPGNGGAYTQVATTNNTSFSFDGNSPCYYVTLNISNACGTMCTGQSICNMACEVEPCILTPPANLTLFRSTLNWAPVTGADHYLVEVTFNDPACCTVDGASGIPQTQNFVSSTNSYDLGFSRGISLPGIPASPRCYSAKVYAICADGSRSEASSYICVHE